MTAQVIFARFDKKQRDTFHANITMTGTCAPGGIWDFTVPFRDGYLPLHGQLLNIGKSWVFRINGETDWSPKTYPTRKHAAFAAWIHYRQPEKRV